MLTVDGLVAGYGRGVAVDGISFAVMRGEVTALLGRNGAGKSTTLKAIVGLVPPAAGRIALGGEPIDGSRPFRICRRGVGYVPEDRRIFAGLSVLENLEAGRRPPRDDAPVWTVQRIFALFPPLAPLAGRPGGQISGGEQQMLAIARTLMGNPRLLLLDEPATGLAPRITAALAAAICELRNQGLTVLVSEQNLGFAGEVAGRALILETGTLRWSGPMTGLATDPDLKHRYLGV